MDSPILLYYHYIAIGIDLYTHTRLYIDLQW